MDETRATIIGSSPFTEELAKQSQAALAVAEEEGLTD